MKAGDIVRYRSGCRGERWLPSLVGSVGLVVDTVQKKVWRTHELGRKVNWDLVEPEPHAVVLFPHNEGTVNIPVCDLESVK